MESVIDTLACNWVELHSMCSKLANPISLFISGMQHNQMLLNSTEEDFHLDFCHLR
jgi:hypothetical protein